MNIHFKQRKPPSLFNANAEQQKNSKSQRLKNIFNANSWRESLDVEALLSSFHNLVWFEAKHIFRANASLTKTIVAKPFLARGNIDCAKVLRSRCYFEMNLG